MPTEMTPQSSVPVTKILNAQIKLQNTMGSKSNIKLFLGKRGNSILGASIEGVDVSGLNQSKS